MIGSKFEGCRNVFSHSEWYYLIFTDSDCMKFQNEGYVLIWNGIGMLPSTYIILVVLDSSFKRVEG